MTDSPSQSSTHVPSELLNAEASIVIFGASGDLTARKLVPALYQLAREGFLSNKSPIVGVARRPKTDEVFRQEMQKAVREHARDGIGSDECWANFAQRLFYHELDIEQPAGYPELKQRLEELEQSRGIAGRRVAYMATTPDLFVPAVEAMSKADMVPHTESDAWLRVVFEKPFGRDLASAQELSRSLGRLLREDQIYRIDHYLGKETVQNILLFRFGNAIFEPLLNRNHVDHIQITVAESQGMERGRGGYYDKSGALRDVLQNHVLQLLCLIAMEPPSMFRAKEIRDEKLKVLQALREGDKELDRWAIAGQYTQAEIDGKPVPGYLQEERIPADSHREAYVAMDVRVDNWRWAGVPFFLRTGKRLPARVTEIAIQFKLPPLSLFKTVECEGDFCQLVGDRPNQLIFRIQPKEAITLRVSSKRPGMQYQIHPVRMDFSYDEEFHISLPEAYERLLLDVLRGDSTLFTRSDELEAAWQFVTPVLEAWESAGHKQPENYPAGTWGPEAADAMLARHGATWRTPDPQ
jgi:glucose-6-phosphate 1-dehydrogenase